MFAIDSSSSSSTLSSRSAVAPVQEPERARSSAFASLVTPLWASGLAMALVVAGVLLSTEGWSTGFAIQWLENWLVVWPIAFPVFYMSGPALRRAIAYAATPYDMPPKGFLLNDIAAAAAAASGVDRHGFTVSRNLRVREGFYAS